MISWLVKKQFGFLTPDMIESLIEVRPKRTASPA